MPNHTVYIRDTFAMEPAIDHVPPLVVRRVDSSTAGAGHTQELDLPAPVFAVRHAPWARRPLDLASSLILDLLTCGLAAPSDRGLVARELGRTDRSVPSVAVESLGKDRFRVTRYVEPDGILTHRAVAPEFEFVRQGGSWFPVSVTLGHYDGEGQELHELANDVLDLVERELSVTSTLRCIGELVQLRYDGRGLRLRGGLS